MSMVLNWGRGGLPLESYLEETYTPSIPNASLPSIAVIPLFQYPGQITRWVLGVGDRVEEGTVIASGPDGALHSPIPGLMERIFDAVLPGNFSTPVAQIRLEGSFTRSAEVKKPRVWESFGSKDLMEILRDRGVLFSSSTLGTLAPVRDTRAEILVINGIQAESYLTFPQHILANYHKEIKVAILILQKIYQVQETILAVNPDLESILKDHEGPYTLAVAEHRYPAGHEKLLLQALSKSLKNVSVEELTAKTLILTPEILFWVYQAVVWNIPVTEKFVAYGGHGFNHAGMIKARIGTPAANLIQDVNGLKDSASLLLSGGPFLGRPLGALWNPVGKNSSGLLALTQGEVNAAREAPCLRCGICLTHCPVELQPVDIFLNLRYRNGEAARKSGIHRCIECGLCSLLCPSRIPLMETIQKYLYGKESQIDRS